MEVWTWKTDSIAQLISQLKHDTYQTSFGQTCSSFADIFELGPEYELTIAVLRIWISHRWEYSCNGELCHSEFHEIHGDYEDGPYLRHPVGIKRFLVKQRIIQKGLDATNDREGRYLREEHVQMLITLYLRCDNQVISDSVKVEVVAPRVAYCDNKIATQYGRADIVYTTKSSKSVCLEIKLMKSDSLCQPGRLLHESFLQAKSYEFYGSYTRVGLVWAPHDVLIKPDSAIESENCTETLLDLNAGIDALKRIASTIIERTQNVSEQDNYFNFSVRHVNKIHDVVSTFLSILSELHL